MTGVLAAFGEELFFRGALQKTLQDWSKNAYVAIGVTAFLFSAIHLQFYGFLPRFLMGILLGYVFYRTGSLWLPIIGHFLFNAIQVSLAYLAVTGNLDVEVESATVPAWLALVAIAAILPLLVRFHKRTEKPSIQTEETAN